MIIKYILPPEIITKFDRFCDNAAGHSLIGPARIYFWTDYLLKTHKLAYMETIDNDDLSIIGEEKHIHWFLLSL